MILRQSFPNSDDHSNSIFVLGNRSEFLDLIRSSVVADLSPGNRTHAAQAPHGNLGAWRCSPRFRLTQVLAISIAKYNCTLARRLDAITFVRIAWWQTNVLMLTVTVRVPRLGEDIPHK